MEDLSRVTQIKFVSQRLKELEEECHKAESERRLWDLENLRQIKQTNEVFLQVLNEYGR